MRKTLNRKKAIKILEILGMKRGRVDVVEGEGFKIYIINGKPFLVEKKGRIVKSITYFLSGNEVRYVKIDKGAVLNVLNGADIFRPGVVEFSSFNRGDSVAILDENGNILGVGISVVSSETLEKMEKGKVLINVYTIKDKVWAIEKGLI